MGKVQKEKKVPILPNGVHVEDLPDYIKYMQRSKGQYASIVQALEALEDEPIRKAVTIDVSGLDKKKILSVKWGIRVTAKRMGFKQKVKCAVEREKMFVWSEGG